MKTLNRTQAHESVLYTIIQRTVVSAWRPASENGVNDTPQASYSIMSFARVH